MVFVIGGERLPAMRNLCAAHSETFDMLLSDSWRDTARGADIALEKLIDIGEGVVTAPDVRCVLDWCHGGALGCAPRVRSVH